jgi:NADPH:quinone reductase-like Zn-dependent oxidoreductase
VQSFDGNAFGDGAILGCDFAGEVVETGSEATSLQKGDIIAGLVWGGELEITNSQTQPMRTERLFNLFF